MSTLPAPAPSSTPLPSVPTPAVQRTRWGAVASCIALLVLGLLWELWLAPTGRGTLALKVLPLALALPGLLRLRLYTYRWLSLAVWLYVTEGLVRATSDTGPWAWLGWLETALATALFIACAAHVRARLAAGAQQLAGAGDAGGA
ncbi:MAG: DUF2069 domain-containing protein [Burkholderiales bacterium]